MVPQEERRALIEAIFAAHRTSGRVLHTRIRAGMAAGGFTFPRILLLRIAAARGRSSSRDLAEALGVTTADLPGLLDKLESDGYVTRRRDPSDRRVVYVEATPKGRNKLRELWRTGMRELGKEFKDWTARDLRALRDLLTRVAISKGNSQCGTDLLTIQPVRPAGRRGRRSS